MTFRCRGKKRYVKDPDTGNVYEMGRKACRESLDKPIAQAIADLKPGHHELRLVCPCEEKMPFTISHCVQGEPEPEKIDFSKLTPVDPALIAPALIE